MGDAVEEDLEAAEVQGEEEEHFQSAHIKACLMSAAARLSRNRMGKVQLEGEDGDEGEVAEVAEDVGIETEQEAIPRTHYPAMIQAGQQEYRRHNREEKASLVLA